MSEATKTVKTAAIYAIGLIINQMAGFIMLPIYTRYLSPADYGTLELLLMTYDIVGLIAGLGLSQAVFRFYFKYTTPIDRNKVLFTTFALALSIYCVVGCLGFFSAKDLGQLILEGTKENTLGFKLIFILFLLEPLQVIPLILIRIQQKPILFISIVGCKLLLQLSLNIFFVIYQGSGMLGILYGTLISHLIFGTFLSIYLLRISGIGFSRVLALNLIVYGAPLIVSNIGNFILTFSDRYFLKAYSDLTTVGIYSLGYKLGFVLTTIVATPIFATWDPKRFQIATRDDFQATNQTVFFFFTITMLFVALAISLFSRDLFRIMSAPDFWDAHKIVPYIMLAYILQGWTMFGNFGIYYKDKTKYLAYTGIICSIVMLTLSFLLIPPFKAYGAAWATIITFYLRFQIIYYFSQRQFRLKLDWGKALLALLTASTLYFLSQIIQQDSILLSLLVNLILLILYPMILFFSPYTTAHHRTLAIQFCTIKIAVITAIFSKTLSR